MGSGTTRLGGLLGVASALAVVPAYLVGSPEVPKTAEDARQYFDEASGFLTANGAGAYATIAWFGLMGLTC